MTINFERLDAAITYGIEHPSEFDMGSWFERWDCGTTACLAGTVAVQAGWSPVFNGPKVHHAEDVEKDGARLAVWHVAGDLLGFTEFDEDNFFHATSLESVIHLRNQYAAARGIPERTWGERK